MSANVRCYLQTSNVRVQGKSGILAETTYKAGYNGKGGNADRDKIVTKINYYAEVDPGLFSI